MLSVVVPNGCTDINELSLPKCNNSAKQVVAHFLRKLDEYFTLKKTPNELNLPLCVRGIEDPFAKQWFATVYDTVGTYENFKGKGIRICIDARRVNALMVPDRVKVDPMKELLQRFHGSKYITTIDLSSAFLQVPLHRSSRKWTSFQFGNQVYQYKVVSYGFKNSLSAFVRALDMVLGNGLENNVVTYVDDVDEQSVCFEENRSARGKFSKEALKSYREKDENSMS